MNALEGRSLVFSMMNFFVLLMRKEFRAWKSKNSTLCSWLFHSVDESIQPSVAGHKIAKEMCFD